VTSPTATLAQAARVAAAWAGPQDPGTDLESAAVLGAAIAHARRPESVTDWHAWANRCIHHAILTAARSGRRHLAVVERVPPPREVREAERLTALAVRLALARLPVEQARVVRLRYWDGLTVAEIGEAMGYGATWVKRRLRAGLAGVELELAAGAGSGETR
jgi:RNA polymerase sigma factor (sigma-70 family)